MSNIVEPEMKMMVCPFCLVEELHFRCESGWMCANCGNVKKEEVLGGYA